VGGCKCEKPTATTAEIPSLQMQPINERTAKHRRGNAWWPCFVVGMKQGLAPTVKRAEGECLDTCSGNSVVITISSHWRLPENQYQVEQLRISRTPNHRRVDVMRELCRDNRWEHTLVTAWRAAEFACYAPGVAKIRFPTDGGSRKTLTISC
jgi:hypothetical protein